MKQMELKGVEFAETTLHVGLGTFNDIMVEDLSKAQNGIRRNYYFGRSC